jgi:hypothetical protein
MKDHGKKIEYRCYYCDKEIPYGSEQIVQDNDYEIYCSVECFCQEHGIRNFDWSTHPEYERTKEELEEIRRKKIEQLKKWEKRKQEEEARRNKYDLKQVESSINELLTDDA